MKAHLDTYHNKKPYGDRYLLKETNYAYKVFMHSSRVISHHRRAG